MSIYLGMGAYANRRTFVTGFEDAPQTINIVQAQTINGFVAFIHWGCMVFMDADMSPLTKGI
ncbi:MAG: hypothetical protein C0408_09675 [Odoribacter sp.]|nr:hypothetical protein [Odoribacter sp.]